MIDLHSHILPGLDDGVKTRREALEVARAAVKDGITTIAATPHVRHDYPTRPKQMESRVERLQAYLARNDVPLRVVPGGEIALEMLQELDDATLRRFGLGGNPGWLLVEMPSRGWPLGLETRVVELQARGFRVVLAHPERNRDVQAAPARLDDVVEAGALVQLTAASVDGRLGSTVQQTAFRLLDGGLAHLIASDAHTLRVRRVGLSGAVGAIDDGPLARWLTEEVPGAIVDRIEPPSRPVPVGHRPFSRVRA